MQKEFLKYRSIFFDDGAKAFLVLLLLGQLYFANGGYLFFGLLLLGTLFMALQQPLKPSIFTLVLVYHFLQVLAGVWLSNYLGRELDYRSIHAGEATIAGFIGIAIMFLPIIYYQRKLPLLSLHTLTKYANRLSLQRSFRAYIIAFFSMNALGGVAFVVPGLSQVIFSLVNIKWFFFLLFGLQVILKKRMYVELCIFIAIEFILGFFSFFSAFKTVIFFSSFLAIIFLRQVSLKQVIIFGIVGYLGFTLAVFWTSIKGEYRAFLNQGNSTQTVNVGQSQAFDKLAELSSNRTENAYDLAAADMLDRVQYTYHLAKTMDRIPDVLPYEYGGNIGSILSYVTTPRFLNPDKPKLEASVKATKYTGIAYAGAARGVSFSLGYFADAYIDFGVVGMMVPLLILGWIFGRSYYYFMKHAAPNFIFGYAVVGAMYMEFMAFEADGTYLMGRLFATLLTFLMLRYFFFPWLYNYLKTGEMMEADLAKERRARQQKNKEEASA